MRKRMLFTWLLYLWLPPGTAARNAGDTAGERLAVHIDRPFYLAGDICWFALYCTGEKTGQLKNGSRTAYVELLDNSGAAVCRGMISLRNGRGSGSFRLPAGMASGTYLFRAYTRWMRNFDESTFYSKALYVVNTFLPGAAAHLDTAMAIAASDRMQGARGAAAVTCTPNDTTAGTRSRVTLQLQCRDRQGQPLQAALSVAVYEAALPPPEAEKQEAGGIPVVPLAAETGRQQYMREETDNIITGKVTDQSTGQPLEGELVFLSIPGRAFRLYCTESDKDGSLIFPLTDYYEGGLLVAQAQSPHALVTLDNPFAPAPQKTGEAVIRPVNDRQGAKEYLRQHHIWLQVQQAFYGNRLSMESRPPADTSAFFGRPDERRNLDEYTRFPTMEEVFRELVQLVAIRGTGKHLQLYTMNINAGSPEQKMFDAPPLVLLDGVPIPADEKLFSYDPLKIRSIAVVAKKYFYGPLVTPGIVSLQTYRGNLDGYPLNSAATVMEYPGVQPQRVFYMPDYAVAGPQQERLPDYRTLLYWNASLQTDTAGMAKMDFYTGDVKGRFVAVVQGIAADGTACYSVTPFQVK